MMKIWAFDILDHPRGVRFPLVDRRKRFKASRHLAMRETAVKRLGA